VQSRKQLAAVTGAFLVMLVGVLLPPMPAWGAPAGADSSGPASESAGPRTDDEKSSQRPSLLENAPAEEPPVDVPGVLGKSYGDARDILSEFGLVGDLAFESPDEGVVVMQKPPEGTSVDVGSSVGLVLSGESTQKPEPKLIQVPDLVGATASAAAATVSGLKLVLAPEGADDEVVVTQEPQPGEELEPGQTINVQYGTAVLVPDIIGAQVDAARETLDEVDLDLIIAGSSIEGTVKSQKPPAGARVKPLSGVSVVVEPAVILEPQPVPEGAEPASNGGLTGASTTPVAPTPASAPPTITSFATETAALGAAEPGSQLAGSTPTTALTAPSATDLIAVPTLLGLRRAEAESTVTAAGLSVSIGGDPDGFVIEQEPAAGTAIQRGSIVAMDLSSVIPIEQSHWYLPPLFVLAMVIGFAGGAAVLHQFQQRPRRTRWLSQHVAFRPAAHPASKVLAATRRKPGRGEGGEGRTGALIPARNQPDHDVFDGRDFDLPDIDPDADHVIALVGHRHANTRTLKETKT